MALEDARDVKDGVRLGPDGCVGILGRGPGDPDVRTRVAQPLDAGVFDDDGISRFFFLGSGLMKGLSDECALKLTEMALDTAFSYRTLEFRHGPKATLNSKDQVIIFPVEAERPHLNTLVAEITATGARVLVVDVQLPDFTDSRVATLINSQPEIRNPKFEVFRPALYAHIGQLLAYWRAAARGLNPDSPRHLARTVILEV